MTRNNLTLSSGRTNSPGRTRVRLSPSRTFLRRLAALSRGFGPCRTRSVGSDCGAVMMST
eukprot:797696-Pyramimonas_sp.AAC.1